MIPRTVDLLLAWDEQRDRSQQTELGMSALGGCRRAAGYALRGFPREKATGTIQAVLGTAVHELAARAASEQFPEALAEKLEVRFAGLLGHPDLYYKPVVRDLKTTGRASTLESWKGKGPPQKHIWQVNAYAAGLIVDGFDASVVQIDYLARDTGDTWLWEAPFDLDAVHDALEWLRLVRETEMGFLPRDFRPESPQCRSCPFFQQCWEKPAMPGRDFRSALFRDDPDAAAWARRLADARKRKAQAEADEADAKGALDALRPAEVGRGGAYVTVPGMDEALHWTRVSGRRRPDMQQISADYAQAGAEPPMITGEAGYRLTVISRPDG
jgi:CRISPR/Cas system-associated exonuclease Cas4 (RecB family)